MTSRSKLLLGLAVSATVFVGLFAAVAGGQEGAKPQEEAKPPTIAREDTEACMACHSSEMEGRHPVNVAGIARSPHKDLKCQDCHTSITAAPHTPEMLKERAACANCHTDQAAAYAKSTHARADLVKGDHPNCITCHGGGDPHAIVDAGKWPRARKVALCENCHRQTQRMTKYGADTDAVASYDESFHGKALLRFGNLKTAICTDCHGHHDVLAPDNPAAPTNANNAAKTCSQPGCHVGAKVNFAMSGANHLRLKIKDTPILQGILIFFRLLVGGTVISLLSMVALDLRKKVFSAGPPPQSGRPVALMVGLSYLCLVATIALAATGTRGAMYAGFGAIGFMVLAFIVYFVLPHPPRANHAERRYERMSGVLQIQHILFAITFTTLILTGLPQRFAQVEWLRQVYSLFGGFARARLIHRCAAVTMVSIWIWHILYLVNRWRLNGWKLRALTAVPTPKDARDFLQMMKHYVGLSHEEPRYGRFQWRQKFDYLAEYWGVPVMVLSGLMLWFPIYFANRLPDSAFAIAYIAHGYEATLAFLAIVSWHLYHVVFSPDSFPISPIFYSRKMTRDEMEREHPLELAELERDSAQRGKDTPSAPPS